jgi:hypothetical protein
VTRPPLTACLALAISAAAWAQSPPAIRLYLGPLPNPDGVIAPMAKDFADSYADLRKAHEKARPAAVELVEDAAQADAILTVTFRGQVDTGTTIGTSRALDMPPTLSSVQHSARTLRARLTVRATGEGVDFSGVSTGDGDRTKWSTQAARIYAQAAAWLESNGGRLVRHVSRGAQPR